MKNVFLILFLTSLLSSTLAEVDSTHLKYYIYKKEGKSPKTEILILNPTLCDYIFIKIYKNESKIDYGTYHNSPFGKIELLSKTKKSGFNYLKSKPFLLKSESIYLSYLKYIQKESRLIKSSYNEISLILLEETNLYFYPELFSKQLKVNTHRVTYSDIQIDHDSLFPINIKNDQLNAFNQGQTFIDLQYEKDLKRIKIISSENPQVTEIGKKIGEMDIPDSVKINKIVSFIIDTLRYDYEAYHSNEIDAELNPDKILHVGKTVCEGYSRMFEILCYGADIPCIKISGIGVTTGETKLMESTLTDHAWNMVKVDGFWYPFDITWIDGTQDKKYYKGNPYSFIKNHLPEEYEYSLVYNVPITLYDFILSPVDEYSSKIIYIDTLPNIIFTDSDSLALNFYSIGVNKVKLNYQQEINLKDGFNKVKIDISSKKTLRIKSADFLMNFKIYPSTASLESVKDLRNKISVYLNYEEDIKPFYNLIIFTKEAGIVEFAEDFPDSIKTTMDLPVIINDYFGLLPKMANYNYESYRYYCFKNESMTQEVFFEASINEDGEPSGKIVLRIEFGLFYRKH